MPAEPDVIGRWTEVKLDILREYAAPYSKILTAYGFHHMYIDALAQAVHMFRAIPARWYPGARWLLYLQSHRSVSIILSTRTRIASTSFGDTLETAPTFASTPAIAIRSSLKTSSRLHGVKIDDGHYACLIPTISTSPGM